MSLSREFSLYLNSKNPSDPLLVSPYASQVANNLAVTSGDVFTLKVYFVDTIGSVPTYVLPDANDSIIFAAKRLVSDSSLVFYKDTWTRHDNYISATLDFSVLSGFWLNSSESSRISLADIEVRNSGNTERITYSFPIAVKRQVFGGETAPGTITPYLDLQAALGVFVAYDRSQSISLSAQSRTRNNISLGEDDDVTFQSVKTNGVDNRVEVTNENIKAFNTNSGELSVNLDTNAGSLFLHNSSSTGVTQTWSNGSNGVVATVNFDGTFEALIGNVQATQGSLIAGLNDTGNNRIVITPTTITQTNSNDVVNFYVDSNGNVQSYFGNIIAGNGSTGYNAFIANNNSFSLKDVSDNIYLIGNSNGICVGIDAILNYRTKIEPTAITIISDSGSIYFQAVDGFCTIPFSYRGNSAELASSVVVGEDLTETNRIVITPTTITQTNSSDVVVFSVDSGGSVVVAGTVTAAGSGTANTVIVNNSTITSANVDRIVAVGGDGKIYSTSAKIGGILNGNVATMDTSITTANADKILLVSSDGKIKASSAKVGGIIDGNVATMNTTITTANADKVVVVSSDGKIKTVSSVGTTVNLLASAQTLTDGATVSWNTNSGLKAKVTLAGNRTMAAPTNLIDGGTYVLFVIQDGTGSRTLTWNSIFKWPNGAAPTLSTTASAVDIISFVSDGTNLYGVAALKFS